MSAIAREIHASRNALPVCLWRENFNRPVRLRDVLQLYARKFISLLDDINQIDQRLASSEYDGRAVVMLINAAEDNCEHLELRCALRQVRAIDEFVRSRKGYGVDGVPIAVLAGMMAELRRRIMEDLDEIVLFQVEERKIRMFFKIEKDPDLDTRRVLVPLTPDDIFGADVTSAFPGAVKEYDESGKCYVAGRK